MVKCWDHNTKWCLIKKYFGANVISEHFYNAHCVPGTILSTLYAYLMCDTKYVKEQVKAEFWRKVSKLKDQQGQNVKGRKELSMFKGLKEKVAGLGVCGV